MARLSIHDDAPFLTALEAAEFFLHVARERGGTLNHRQLQNLLYYAQGFSQLSRGTLLFPDPIEAHDDGPTIAAVERVYACHGDQPIPVPEGLTPLDHAWYPGSLIYATDLEFGSLNCEQLNEQLLSEPPWREARINGDVVDPQAVGQLLYEQVQANRARRGSKARVKWSDYLRQHPELAERLQQAPESGDAIPLR